MSKAITIAIKNNTTIVQAVQLGITPNVFSGINATTQYRWDITSQNLNDLTTIEVTYVLNGLTTTVSADIQSDSVDGIISALNGLGVGTFWSTTSGGSTFINTYNDFITYTNLVINNAHNIEIEVAAIIGTTLSFELLLTSANQVFWDWGDGTIDEFNINNPFPTHTYTVAGNYTVLITIVTPTSLLLFSTNGAVMSEINSISFLGNVFTALQTLLIQLTGITAFDSASLSSYTSLTSINLGGNQLATFDLSSLPNSIPNIVLTQNNISSINTSSIPASLTGFFIVNNSISTSDVNSILIRLDSAGLSNGIVDTSSQSPAAPPSGAGITAKNNLIGKGWTVTTD